MKFEIGGKIWNRRKDWGWEEKNLRWKERIWKRMKKIGIGGK